MTKIVEIGEGEFGNSSLTRSQQGLEIGDGSSGDGTVQYTSTIKEVKLDLGRPVEKDEAGIGKRHPTPIITYEAFMWFMFITTTGLAIVDRFVWNVWPRQTFSIGAGSAGSDRLVGFKPGPWSVVLYDILARISGRYAILCYNFLLITRLKSLEYWLMNDSFVARYLLDCANVVEANNRLHNYNGIGLCVLTLLHIWSILFPCITHGYTAKMIPGVWEWPASERTPVKCSVKDVPGCWPGDANNELKQMGLQADDVFRLVEMTLFLMILMPLSVKWLATRWHAAIQLHRLINIVYFVDIVRRHSHPHSWILNTPIFVIYCIDAFVWSSFWRRDVLPEVTRMPLGKDYMVLYWVSKFKSSKFIAPHYTIIMKKSAVLEEKHIFTCLENRLDLPIPDIAALDKEGFEYHVSSQDLDTVFEDNPNLSMKWDTACVIRVFRDARTPRLGKREPFSHTKRMYEESPDYIIRGPIPGEMSLQLKSALESQQVSGRNIILVGAGSACNFILDFLLWAGSNKHISISSRDTFSLIKIIYTTRDLDLFEWVTVTLASILQKCDEHFAKRVDLHLSNTGEVGILPQSLTSSMHNLNLSTRYLTVLDDRIDLRKEIDSEADVFCQGSASFKNAVEELCKKNNSSFYGGEGGH